SAYQRMRSYRNWFDQRQLIITESPATDNRIIRNRQVLHHSTVLMDTTHFHIDTTVWLAHSTSDAGVAIKVWQNRNAVPRRKYAAVTVDKFGGEFVSKYSGIREIWLDPFERMKVCSAYTDPVYAHERLTF